MPRFVRSMALILLLILCFSPAAAELQIAKRVVASGGKTMGSTSYGVSGTAGQLAAGALASENFASLAGFWFLRNNTATGVGDVPGIPRVFALEQNYPNPFNPATTIPFALPRESFVRLRVFDVAGRLVDELVDEFRPAGHYREAFVTASLASGVYFYRLEADGLVKTRSFVLVK